MRPGGYMEHLYAFQALKENTQADVSQHIRAHTTSTGQKETPFHRLPGGYNTIQPNK